MENKDSPDHLVAATTTEYRWYKNCLIEHMIFEHGHWFSRFTRAKPSWKRKNQWPIVKNVCWFMHYLNFFSHLYFNVQYTTFPLIEWLIRISLITLVAATTTEYHWFKNRVTELMMFDHDHRFSRFTRTKHSWKRKNQCLIVKNLCWVMHYLSSVSAICTVL